MLIFFDCIQTLVDELKPSSVPRPDPNTPVPVSEAAPKVPNTENGNEDGDLRDEGYLIPFSKTKTNLESNDDTDWSIINAASQCNNNQVANEGNLKWSDEFLHNTKNQKNTGTVLMF